VDIRAEGDERLGEVGTHESVCSCDQNGSPGEDIAQFLVQDGELPRAERGSESWFAGHLAG
jgi:hypothetical protein